MGCEALYIYNDMTYIYIYIGHLCKTCPDTLTHPLSIPVPMGYGVCCILRASGLSPPNARVYTAPLPWRTPPPPVSNMHHFSGALNCL